MEGQVVVITYTLQGPRDAYIEENLPYARPIADVPGLRWKIWIINEEHGEAGGVYLFQDAASAQAFIDGPIITEMKGDPSLSIKTFEVLEQLTTVTRGPIE
jgi:hypothetical protein